MKRARRLRREQTLAERLLWAELRKLNMNFRRQAPIGAYVADFVHHASQLVVEVDGYYHLAPERQARDAERTAWLNAQGYRVLRFSEDQVRNSLADIVRKIEAEAAQAPKLARPRPKGEPRYQIR